MQSCFEDIVKGFFRPDEWKTFVLYRRLQYVSEYKIHLELHKTGKGLNVVPGYVAYFCKKQKLKIPESLLDIRSVTDLENASKIKRDVTNADVISAPMVIKNRGKIEKIKTSKRYCQRRRSKRKLKLINYYEAEVAEDNFVYCDDCEHEFVDQCPYHGPLIHIPDNYFPMGTLDRASKTLPRKYFRIKRSAVHGLGVFAITDIPKGTLFGPCDGVLAKDCKSNGDYSWALRKPFLGLCIDTFDTKFSNWMRYVNCSSHITEQNMHAFQYRGGIYYKTCCNIPTGEELLVYYGDEFANLLQIDVNNYVNPRN